MNSPDKALEDIIRDFQCGRDREQNFYLLYSRFYGQVCRYLQHKGMPLEDSRDLAQEVFYQVFKGLDAVRSESHFVAWLFTVSRNAFNNEIDKRYAKKRSAGKLASGDDEGESDDLDGVQSSSPGSSALKQVLDREKVRALMAALEKLPEQMRRCVYLRVTQDRSPDEIATLLGISSSTVRVHIHKARKTLEEVLRPVFGDLQV